MVSRRSQVIAESQHEARAHVDLCREIRKRGVGQQYVTDEEIKKWAKEHGAEDVSTKTERIAKIADDKMKKMQAKSQATP